MGEGTITSAGDFCRKELGWLQGQGSGLPQGWDPMVAGAPGRSTVSMSFSKGSEPLRMLGDFFFSFEKLLFNRQLTSEYILTGKM